MTELNLEDPIQDQYKHYIGKLLWQSAQNLSGLTQEKCLYRHKAQGGCPPSHGYPRHFSFNQAPSIWRFHQHLEPQRPDCWILTGQFIKGRRRGGYCRPLRKPTWTGQTSPQLPAPSCQHHLMGHSMQWGNGDNFVNLALMPPQSTRKSKPGRGNELDLLQWIWVVVGEPREKFKEANFDRPRTSMEGDKEFCVV